MIIIQSLMFVLPGVLEEFKPKYVRMYVCMYLWTFTSLPLTWDGMASPTHQDNHPGEVINRAEFGVCRSINF